MKSHFARPLALPFAAGIRRLFESAQTAPLTPEAFVRPRAITSTRPTTTPNPNTGGARPAITPHTAVQVPGNEVANTVNRVLASRSFQILRPAQYRTGVRPNLPDVVTNEIRPLALKHRPDNHRLAFQIPRDRRFKRAIFDRWAASSPSQQPPIFANKVLRARRKTLREKGPPSLYHQLTTRGKDDIQKWITL